jgi:hypothetical protein
LKHIPGDLDLFQKGKSLDPERDSGRKKQGSDRSHSERKTSC